jgi:cyclopropane fatty-acyl-phospholipid synthase-like methyltransferase
MVITSSGSNCAFRLQSDTRGNLRSRDPLVSVSYRPSERALRAAAGRIRSVHAKTSDREHRELSDQTFIPALRFESLTRFYDPVVGLATREALFKARIVEQLSPQPGQRILDLGCGSGTLAIAINRKQPAARMTELDAGPQILDRARTKAGGSDNVSFDEGFSTDLPYEDSAFDAIVSTLFFHHLSPDARRKTAKSAAKPPSRAAVDIRRPLRRVRIRRA